MFNELRVVLILFDFSMLIIILHYNLRHNGIVHFIFYVRITCFNRSFLLSYGDKY